MPRLLHATLTAAMIALAGMLFTQREATSIQRVHFAPVDVQLSELDKAVERFAGMLRFATVSNVDAENHVTDPKAFDALLKYMSRSYPLVFKRLEVEEINRHSLLLTWRGSDPALPPALCVSHLDVVPVAGSEAAWTRAPFSGAVADGHVWGRGALDVKVTAAAMLEAASHLLARGAQPRRTLYLAFGHDEEVSGLRGAGAIAARLRDAGVKLAFIFDEGGALLVDGMPGITRAAVAVVGTSEKAAQIYRLEVHGRGGHSMTPPVGTRSVVSRLAHALQRLEASLPRPRLERPTSDLLKALAAVAERWPVAALLANCEVWPLSVLAALLLSRMDGDMSACTRTTAVVTDIGATPAGKNVIPSIATAHVNFRILPGESPTYAADLLAAATRGERTGGDVRVVREDASPIAPLSSADDLGFRAIQRAAHETLHQPQGLVVAPYLMLGGTDSKHYAALGLTRQIFRFMPFAVNRSAGDLRGVHGVDERVGTAAYLAGVKFYVRFFEHALW